PSSRLRDHDRHEFGSAAIAQSTRIARPVTLSGVSHHRRRDRGDAILHINYALLGTFALLWFAIIPTPGPNTLLIVQLALTAGWRDLALALAGNLVGIVTYALCTLLGLALLLSTAPSARLVIYLLGGAYLVWVGLRLVRAGLERRRAQAVALNGIALEK